MVDTVIEEDHVCQVELVSIVLCLRLVHMFYLPSLLHHSYTSLPVCSILVCTHSERYSPEFYKYVFKALRIAWKFINSIHDSDFKLYRDFDLIHMYFSWLASLRLPRRNAAWINGRRHHLVSHMICVWLKEVPALGVPQMLESWWEISWILACHMNFRNCYHLIVVAIVIVAEFFFATVCRTCSRFKGRPLKRDARLEFSRLLRWFSQYKRVILLHHHLVSVHGLVIIVSY